MRMFAVFILFTLAAYSSAQVIGFGGCPDIAPVDGFNFTRYAGRWYEIARFYYASVDGVEGIRCQSVNYTLGDEYIYANNSGFANGRAFSFKIPIRRPTENVGKLYYENENGPAELSVAFVDYDKYVMLHGCTEYLWGFINVQINFILARQRRMSEEDFDDALRFLTSRGVNVRKFIESDQQNCPF
nr:apolipoprotein D-like [Lytechinus pictus]